MCALHAWCFPHKTFFFFLHLFDTRDHFLHLEIPLEWYVDFHISLTLYFGFGCWECVLYLGMHCFAWDFPYIVYLSECRVLCGSMSCTVWNFLFVVDLGVCVAPCGSVGCTVWNFLWVVDLLCSFHTFDIDLDCMLSVLSVNPFLSPGELVFPEVGFFVAVVHYFVHQVDGVCVVLLSFLCSVVVWC